MWWGASVLCVVGKKSGVWIVYVVGLDDHLRLFQQLISVIVRYDAEFGGMGKIYAEKRRVQKNGIFCCWDGQSKFWCRKKKKLSENFDCIFRNISITQSLAQIIYTYLHLVMIRLYLSFPSTQQAFTTHSPSSFFSFFFFFSLISTEYKSYHVNKAQKVYTQNNKISHQGSCQA